MDHISNNATVTQQGQAQRINLQAFTGLKALFAPLLGPHHASKMLINNTTVSILTDGRTLLDSIMFTHPVTGVINKAAMQSHDILGDGVCVFVVFGGLVFQNAVGGEESVVRGNEGILNDLNLLVRMIEGEGSSEKRKGLSDARMNDAGTRMNDASNTNTQSNTSNTSNDKRDVVFYMLNTKMDEDLAHRFASIALSAYRKNLQMVEILKMDGDVADSAYFNGLVLDHGARHPAMPRDVAKACVLVCNVSLEYEKPEINTAMHFASAAERARFVHDERAGIDAKIARILAAERRARAVGKRLVVLTERGIDLPALDRLQGVLCLRRVKRRNLERLLRLCGGKIVTTADDIKIENAGYAGRVFVKEAAGRAYTYVEKCPYTGSATVLVRGNNEYERERIAIALKSALKMLGILETSPAVVRGGPANFLRWSGRIRDANGERTAVSEALYQLYKAVGAENGDVAESAVVLSRTLFNAGMIASTLLMVDEIIKAGKSVKEEKNEQN